MNNTPPVLADAHFIHEAQRLVSVNIYPFHVNRWEHCRIQLIFQHLLWNILKPGKFS